jgi:hypothetical protein
MVELHAERIGGSHTWGTIVEKRESRDSNTAPPEYKSEALHINNSR